MRKAGVKQRQAGPSRGLIQWTYVNTRFGSEQGLERDVSPEERAAEGKNMRGEKAKRLLSGQRVRQPSNKALLCVVTGPTRSAALPGSALSL